MRLLTIDHKKNYRQNVSFIIFINLAHSIHHDLFYRRNRNDSPTTKQNMNEKDIYNIQETLLSEFNNLELILSDTALKNTDNWTLELTDKIDDYLFFVVGTGEKSFYMSIY